MCQKAVYLAHFHSNFNSLQLIKCVLARSYPKRIASVAETLIEAWVKSETSVRMDSGAKILYSNRRETIRTIKGSAVAAIGIYMWWPVTS